VLDPVTVAKLWLLIKPIKRIRERRRAKRAEFSNQEVPVNPIVFQILLALLRHAMTALAPFGVTVSDDWMVQTITVIVGLVGFGWSVARKLKK
jgi:hypothetical protein